jgi:hypothetical protein
MLRATPSCATAWEADRWLETTSNLAVLLSECILRFGSLANVT